MPVVHRDARIDSIDSSKLASEEVELLSCVYQRALSDPEFAKQLARQVGALARILPVFRRQVVAALDLRRTAVDDQATMLLLCVEFHQATVVDGISAADAHERMGEIRGIGTKAVEARLTKARKALGLPAPPKKRLRS